jgi:glucosamine--fructose-6-phosphate aminotransferase (isomerizing)
MPLQDGGGVQLSVETIRGRYLEDVLAQPQALRDTWNGLRNSSVVDAIARDCTPERFKRVVLTGMGGSFFGLHVLSIELAAHGWTPLMLETSELIHSYAGLLNESTLLVAVSQSGRSAETLRVLEMNGGRATVIGITNDALSPLGTQSAFAVVTAAGEEYSVSCKTYVATLLALRVLGAALCGMDVAARLHELQGAAPAVEAYLANWQAHAGELMDTLKDARHFFLVGRGTSLAAARAGALVIKESTHVHAEGMSSAAFRHGPFEMLSPEVFVGVLAGDEPTRALNHKLVADICGAGAQGAWIAPDAKQAAFRLPETDAILRPVVEILLAQMMTLALAGLRNREPGRFVRATKITAIE